MSDENSKRSIIDEVYVGDSIFLAADGKFFLRNDGLNELYAGFVSYLKPGIVGLSVTPHTNIHHGYVGEKKQDTQLITKIETNHIVDWQSFIYKKKDEKKKGDLSFLRNVHIGDLVMLSFNGGFFGRKDELPERYIGFVTLLEPGSFSLSTTHHYNCRHGYFTGEKKDQERIIIDFRLEQMLNYKIIKEIDL